MNYVKTHLHTMLSNATTNIDSVVSYDKYINRATELEMKAIAFTEHGNIMGWYNKKKQCEKMGLKYIHGCEAYITASLTEKVRDNYHVCLYALNQQGFYELNKLISKSWNRTDGHYYYVPRIHIDEFLNISKNISVASACLGGVLNSNNEELKNMFIQYFVQNKDRCFLEIQHHLVSDQAKYNKYICELANKHNLKLIAGTDTHSLDQLTASGRIMLQKAKNIHFDNEDGWDLTFKSYDELLIAYRKQGVILEQSVLDALNNTNVLADMVEEISVDYSHKYPALYSNSEEIFKQKINDGFKKRNIPKERIENYKQRVYEEYEVYKKTGSINYMLFMDKIIEYAKQEGVLHGYGRGSVNGSLIAYLLGITEMDAIKFDLNFFRFCNPERISLMDVDCDFSNSDREKIKQYLFQFKGLYTSEIITFNTIALKGAIRDIGRALQIPLAEVNEISDNIEIQEVKYRQKYPELFKYVDIVNGVVVSIGSHPSGVLTSPISLDESVGLCTLSTNPNPVSQLYMKELDAQNYVKMDVLGLDTIDVINQTCKLAGIERINPDTFDLNDERVWISIRDNSTSIFQWESNTAQNYIKQLFSNSTIENIKKSNPDMNYLDLFSFGNGAIRPGGDSYREEAATGVFKNNGFKELNEFLNPTMGYLCYQETLMQFLVKFCGYSMAESDSVRRGVAKKEGTEQFIPEIRRRFIEHSHQTYGLPKYELEKIIEPFLEVIISSSAYMFSLNHSQPYSILGYACGWLRHYYPLEYLTSCLNVFASDQEKTQKLADYANGVGVKIKPIKFRYSKSTYFFDKESNSIYKGIASIKYLNEQVGEQLYLIKDLQFETFVDLLIHTEEEMSINTKQMEILIRLGFFDEFGKNGKLLNIYEEFCEGKMRYDKKHKDKTKLQRTTGLKEIEKTIENIIVPMKEQLEYELELLGSPQSRFNLDSRHVYVMSVDTKYSPKLNCYCLANGKTSELRIDKKTFNRNKVQKGDIIYMSKVQKKPKQKKNGEFWETIPNEFTWWITEYSIKKY